MLVIHLLNHEGSAEAEEENRVAHLHRHLSWSPEFADRIVRSAERQDLICCADSDELSLTDEGRELARMALTT